MSAVNLGIDHDSDEVVALKATISVKDNEITMLKVHLDQAAQRRAAVDVTLKETNHKLQSEADRRAELEEELRITSEACTNQKTAHDNVELALNQLQERFKAEQKVVRDLQATIDSLTARTEGDKQERVQKKSVLEKRNNQLQSRIQELEFECHQLKAAPRSKFTNGRTSTSTVTTDPQFIWLQQENERLRNVVTEHESDTEAFEKRISHLQTEVTKMENQKVANERSWQNKVVELQDKVDDMSEELEYLRQQTGETSVSREQQLMDRIDEDATKMEQLQRQVAQAQRMQSTLVQTEEKLTAEMKKVEEAEAMNTDLVREKDAVLDELEATRAESEAQQQQIRELQSREKELQLQVDEAQDALAEPTFRIPENIGQSISRETFEDDLMEADADLTYLIRSTPLRPDNSRSNRRTSLGRQPVNYEVVERLLATIDRLRGERDDVKGHLEFSQVEHKFAVQAYERRILTLSSGTDSDKSFEVSNLEDEIRRLREEANIALAKVEDSQLEAKRSQLAASAFSLVIERVRENSEHLTAQYGVSLRTNEELLSDANRRASVAESQLSEATQRHNQAEHNCQLLSARVEELEGVIQRLGQEASENVGVYRQLCEDLEAAKAAADHLRKVIQEVEAERDSLNLRVAHLEDDLSTARTEHEDLQSRYQTVRSQQLSSMSSTQASRALRQQIEELEGRVNRRTEQIGLHQHDIRRLETNLRLQEDRIAEMTADIETLTNQKEAMVEDCAEAREARDHAIQRVEVLEEQVESFEERLLFSERERDERNADVTTLVKVVVQGVSDKRNTTTQLKKLLHSKSECHRDVQGQLHHAQEHIHSLVQRIRELESTVVPNTQDTMDVDEDSATAIAEDLHQFTVALALSQTAYRGAISSLSSVKDQHASAGARVLSLQQELQALRDRQSADDASHIQFQSHIDELESTIRGLEDNLQEADSRQEQTSQELLHAQEELRDRVEQADEQTHHITGLQAEVEKLSRAQSDKAHELQQQLEKAQLELVEAVRVQDEVDTECKKLREEIDTANKELGGQLEQVQELSTVRALLEKELSEIRSAQAEELTRLREELSETTAAIEKASVEQDTVSKEQRTVIDDLTHAKSDLEEKLADAETRFTTLQQQFDYKLQAWTQSEEKLQDKLRFTVERTEADLRQTIRTLEGNLEASSSALETVNEEKDTMEAEMTNLEAEIQRYRTLSQYLEKQVKEQESEISDLGGRLAVLRKDHAALEQESSGIELQLSLKDVQHRESLASLQRELDALREKPDLEARLQELQERCDEMEEDLKEKCAEIERTDDKYLVVLKERKKLNFQVDSLMRKVKALEKELADAVTKPPHKTKEISTSQPPVQAPAPSRTSSTSSRRSTATNPSQASSRSSSARTSAVFSTDSAHPLPNARQSAASASSSRLHRAKTPEPKVRPEAKPAAAPTFPAQQPEPVTIGKKRRAPDDFDACESVPAQVFTPESIPSKAAESQTPRSRKTATSNRGGFTPVRSRPPSKDPVGRVAAPALDSTATITDVTNGTAQRSVTQPVPRTTHAAQPPAKARSWLRNVKPPTVSR